uniref:Putative golgin subfamily protein a member 5 n=1 Tax=Ixodes ricinus TaxID=34613 RepID=A0A6B0VBJ8_IXORI
MDSGRTSACAFWLQTPASLNEAAQLSARVNQQANFGSDLFKQSTLDDCLENVPQQSRKKLEVSADDDYWNSSGQVGFSFEDDWDDSKRSASFNELPPQPRNNLKHGATGKGTDLKLPSPSSASVPLPSSPQSRRLDLGDIQKHAEKLRIGTQAPPKYSRDTSVTPEETVKNIIVGQPYYLEQHRSKESKVALLNEAIRLQDGNAITAVVLFLKRTLKPSLFNQELMQRPKAISHYVNHLRSIQDNTQLVDVLGMLGRTEDAAMVKYKLATEIPEAAARLRNLQSCLKSHFQSDPLLSFQAELIKDEIKLLEMQLVIEEEDARVEKEGQNLLMREFPRKASVVGTPLVSTLYYCCMYHYNTATSNISNPSQMRTLFNSWLGKSKMRCCIGFDKAVEVLAKAQAPPEVFERYLQLVDDTDRRLSLATQYKCHRVAIDTLVSLRDRQRLIKYRDDLTPQSAPFVEVQHVLNNSVVKWKN